MKIQELFNNKTVISFEVFPPKANSPKETIYETLNELKALSPDYISVTYGAFASKNDDETFNIASTIKDFGVESVAHLPAIGMTRAEVYEKLEELKKRGVKNIMALRGDLPKEAYQPGDFPYASELIRYIKSQGDFNIVAACYPECHVEANNFVEDIKNLKTKVDAGVSHLVTQLFLDNSDYYSFCERCALAGIEVPIQAGIMPVVNKRQMERISEICGVKIPEKFQAMMARYEDNPIAMRDAGIAYAVDQIVDLITHGAPGIHIYTMNNPYIAKRIHEAICNII